MLDIKKHIAEILRDDEDITELLGDIEEDDRIYTWNPSEDILYSNEDNLISAIFFRIYMSDDRPYRWSYPSQMPNIHIHFRIKSLFDYNATKIAEQVINLFDIKEMIGDDFRLPSIQLSIFNDGPIEGSPSIPLYVKNVQFICRNVLRR